MLRVHKACLLAGLAWAGFACGGGALGGVTPGGWFGASVAWAQDQRQPRPGRGGAAPTEGAPVEVAVSPTPVPSRRLRPADDTAGPGDPLTPSADLVFGRQAPADGDLAEAPPAPQPVDGAIDDGQPAATVDGVDQAVIAAQVRDGEAPFTLPRGPDDTDAFADAVEPVPALSRAPQRLFQFEPYAPVGIRVGSFTLFPEAEIAGVAFDNVFRSHGDTRSDAALEVKPALRLLSTWARHAVEIDARGLTSFHGDFPGEDDRAWSAQARGRLDITRRTNIEAQLSRDVAQETRGSVNAAIGVGSRADFTTDRAGVTLNHTFNRLSLQLRGAVSDREASPSTDPAGAILGNRDRDITQREAALRATWQFKPELGVFGEVGFDTRDYRAPSISDGIERDSSGERYRVGVSFGSTSRVLRGEVSVGALEQRFVDRRLPDLKGIIVDANVAWRFSGLTSLIVAARSDVGESTFAGSGGSITRSLGADVRHAFRSNLIGTAGVRYTRGDFPGSAFVEEDVTTTAGLEYFLNRETVLFSRYAHVDFSTPTPNSAFTADEIRIGVRIRR